MNVETKVIISFKITFKFYIHIERCDTRIEGNQKWKR